MRPQPSSGALGGTAPHTRDALLLAEAAGFGVVLVETVGVGQSETAVAGMIDMFALLQLPNAGDDLQALKKGITELADIIVVNKADLDKDAATRAQAQIAPCRLRLLGLHGRSEGMPDDAEVWHPRVLQASALTGQGMAEFWADVARFRAMQSAGSRFARRRQQQSEAWMRERLEAGLRQRFRAHPAVQAAWPGVLEDVRAGRLAASVAARRLLDLMD